MTTIATDIQKALDRHKAGDLSQAEQIYRDILRVDAAHPEALHLLGLVAHQSGHHAAAIDLIGRAIQITGPQPLMSTNLGAAFQAQGDLAGAVSQYQQAIAAAPDYWDAHRNLGTALAAQQKFAEAARCYQHVLDHNPDHHDARGHLGCVLQQMGRLNEAIDCFQQVLTALPNELQTRLNLGTALAQLGRVEAAATHFEQIVQQSPDHEQAHYNLGRICQDRGRLQEAAEHYRIAVANDDTAKDAWNNLGVVLKSLRQHDEAESCFRRLLELDDTSFFAHFNLGNVLRALDRQDEAVECYQRSLQLQPSHVETYINLGAALSSLGDLREAERQFRAAIKVQPNSIEAHINLAAVLQLQGLFSETAEVYRAAQQIAPQCVHVHSNPLMLKLYQPDVGGEEILREHIQWSEKFAPAPARLAPFSNSPDPDRRLRIGYVSPDFRVHPVGFFIETILKNHDKSRFEVCCYAELPDVEDFQTKRIRAQADLWRNTFRKSDERCEQQIREDRIDILIDLAGHTSGHRLGVFGKKPAPVQMTYLGYGTTTGLKTVDYRLTDAIADPPDEPNDHTEELLRLPVGILCYEPPQESLEVAALPQLENGFVTFGSFNTISKLSEPTLATWARLLRSVPDSRLILKNRSFTDQSVRQRYLAMFAEQGIAAERVELLGLTKTIDEHLKLYHRIDIGLDPFPYGGATTTCEALWMGVPVVTLRGQAFVGRMTASVLTRVGLPEWITESHTDYVNLAAWWAESPQKLAMLRQGMREMVARSPLCDQQGYVHGLEDAYRNAWKRWCSETSNHTTQRAG